MNPPRTQLAPNKTQELFYKINDYTSLMGRLNLWDADSSFRSLPALSKNYYYKLFYTFINILVVVLMLLQFCAIYRRDEFDSKKMTDWIIFTFTNPLLLFFHFNILYRKNETKALLLCLTVMLKKVYNDEKVEREMIKRAKFYMAAYLLLCSLSLLLYGFDGLLQVILSGKNFITIVTVWPDEQDESKLASMARIIFYFIWWIIVFRASNGYMLAISSTICLSYQFKTLHSYFYGLNEIFSEQLLTQTEKEDKYEKAFKVGIKLHSDTLWCTKQCQMVYGLGYTGQTTISLMGLVVVMFQLVNSERTLLNALALVATAFTILVTTGIFMWNAGDVTVEASGLATAMYCSGWENCERASSIRVRKLLVIGMTQAQKPVIIRAFGGIMDLSYGSYLSIVKSSYSVFSVVY